MKAITLWVMGSLLLFATAACGDNVAKTNTNAPAALEQPAETPAAQDAEEGQEDAMSQARRQQLNADIRAREQRDQIGGADGERDEDDLASEVRSKLEANLPASFLTVEAEEGAVTIKGTVPTEEQFQRIEPLAKEINGVEQVIVQAKVQPATPQGSNNNAQ